MRSLREFLRSGSSYPATESAQGFIEAELGLSFINAASAGHYTGS